MGELKEAVARHRDYVKTLSQHHTIDGSSNGVRKTIISQIWVIGS